MGRSEGGAPPGAASARYLSCVTHRGDVEPEAFCHRQGTDDTTGHERCAQYPALHHRIGGHAGTQDERSDSQEQREQVVVAVG